MQDNEQKYDVFDESSAPPPPPPRSKLVPILAGIAVVAIAVIGSIMVISNGGDDGAPSDSVEPVSARLIVPPDSTPSPTLTLPPVEPQRALFGFDRSDLTSSARGVLQGMCEQLEGRTGTVTLDGYADSIGSEEYNRGLSTRRAAAVRDFLRACVDGIGYQANGHGELPDDGSAEQRRQNRRVDIQFESGG